MNNLNARFNEQDQPTTMSTIEKSNWGFALWELFLHLVIGGLLIGAVVCTFYTVVIGSIVGATPAKLVLLLGPMWLIVAIIVIAAIRSLLNSSDGDAGGR
jgi:hypothetical protein